MEEIMLNNNTIEISVMPFERNYFEYNYVIQQFVKLLDYIKNPLNIIDDNYTIEIKFNDVKQNPYYSFLKPYYVEADIKDMSMLLKMKNKNNVSTTISKDRVTFNCEKSLVEVQNNIEKVLIMSGKEWKKVTTIHLCRTNFFNYNKEINYPFGAIQQTIFKSGFDIPPLKFSLKKVNENRIEGSITLEEKKEIYVIQKDMKLPFLDLENIELESRDRFYKKNRIIIRKPYLLEGEKDLCLLEGDSRSIKKLLQTTCSKQFKDSSRNELYWNKINFDFPKDLTERIGEKIKGMWLKVKGADLTNLGVYGCNVDKSTIIEDIKMEKSTKITSIHLYVRNNGKSHLYMLSQKGTLLFYSKLKVEEVDNLVFHIFNIFKNFEVKRR